MFEDVLSKLSAEPPRSLDLLPGLRIKSAVSGGPLLIPLAFVVLFALMPLFILSADPGARLAIGQTRVTQARVISVASDAACRANGNRITYAFRSPVGTEYRATSSVCPDSAYFAIRPDESIPVKYLVSDPSINAIAGQREANTPPIALFAIFPLFALLIFTPMFVPQLREVLRARRFVRRGRVARGSVLFVRSKINSPWPGWSGSSISDVFVTHQLSSGVSVEAIVKCSNNWLLYHLSPGTSVYIAYLPGAPSKAVLLDAYVR